MPHPHEQKLHEVVNSLTCESFRSFVAARIAGTSRSPVSASPAPPPRVTRKRSLRLIVDLGVPIPSTGLSDGLWIGASGDSSMGFLRAHRSILPWEPGVMSPGQTATPATSHR